MNNFSSEIENSYTTDIPNIRVLAIEGLVIACMFAIPFFFQT